jgi:molecular chaperone GrpE
MSQVDQPSADQISADDHVEEAEVTEVIDPSEIALEPIEEEEIDRLRAQLSQTEARLRTVSAAYKDLQADMKAFQKRFERQQELKLEVAKGETVSKLFNPMEDLRRSIDAIKKAGLDEGMSSGLEMVHREFMEGFTKLGLTEVAEQGAPFDPLYHEVLSVIPIPNPMMDGRILEVFAQGYRVGARLIRPAKVIVAKGPEEPAAAEE